jgi:nucleotide-binding universal stress UspA family protein
MYKYIVVPVTGSAEDDVVFETAFMTAMLFASHIEFLYTRIDVTELVVSMTSTGMLGTAPRVLAVAPQTMINQFEAEVARHERRARRLVGEFCRGHEIPLTKTPLRDAVSAEFTVAIGSAERTISEYGAFADVLVIGRPQPGSKMAVLRSALMDTRRPLLMVPDTLPTTLLGTVVVAWKNTPEALHAVIAALPLLERAERVEVISIGEEDNATDPNFDRALHGLSCHTPNIYVHQVRREDHGAVDVLLQEVERLHASLIVMGGYSHSRLREAVFGGFTQRILSGVNIPVLMAH